MAKEIERRYLVEDTRILAGSRGFPIVQGYLFKDSLRVRVRTFGDSAFLALKGQRVGIARDEYEYQIPMDDALEILGNYCLERKITKTRHLIPAGRHVFEVDVYEGGLTGLVVAEVELSREDEAIELPGWIGPEVTQDRRYRNFYLAVADGIPARSEIPVAEAAKRDADSLIA